MRKTTKSPGEKTVKDIEGVTRKLYSSEENIRIVPDGLRGEDNGRIRSNAVAKVSGKIITTNSRGTSGEPANGKI